MKRGKPKTTDEAPRPHAEEHFRRFDAEAWIIGKLGNPRHIVDGISTYESRKPLIRAEIIDRGLENQRMVSKREETFGQVFARFYGEPLRPATQGTTG